ncbi:MAG: tRNA preQ1(34) S-adenosylmethionine ribosyltransferase-isomerase QueA [Gemmatimonadales bacterium]
MKADQVATADFEYHLPAELIAQTPSAVRGESRLLMLDRDRRTIADRHFVDLAELIPPGDLLVLNSTKVRHARLLGRRPSGAPAEVLLIHPGADDTWVAMGQPGSALRPGKRIALGEGIEVETVAVLDGANRLVRFVGGTAEQAMDRFGRLPLPPYIERAPDGTDDERYQTVFAEREGSVAAPTAGLHFTAGLLAALGDRGVAIEQLDLEVGPGTFQPVEATDPREHRMHRETFTIPESLAERFATTRQAGRHVWAVGTTVVRALESAIRAEGGLRVGPQATELLILPGFEFRAVDRLITNFHLPRSTLLMLVSAFGGMALVREGYRHAIEARYRFYSYGDAMVIR